MSRQFPVMITGYLVATRAVPEIALAPGFTDWLNATLIGASANVVAAGICASRGRHVSFVQFLRIGLPIAVVQLSVGALYVWILALMLG